jgi:hypothetical protein
MYHYILEKRDALTRWTPRLTETVGHDPNGVMEAERKGYQGRGAARRLDRVATYAERKARLAAHGRDLDAERRERHAFTRPTISLA